MNNELFVGELGINYFLQAFSSPIADAFFILFTLIGEPFFIILLSAWFFWWGKEKISLTLTTILLFNAAIVGAIKYSIRRPRPNLELADIFTTKNSFPSGHITIISTIYSFFEKQLSKKMRLIFLIIIFFVSLSRLYLGVHYLSDVIFGFFIGYLIGKLILKLQKMIDLTLLELKKRKTISITLMLIGFILISFLLPNKLYLAILLIGYFIGYLLYKKEFEITNILHKILFLLIGTIILTSGFLIASNIEGIYSSIIFLISGIFITFIWPKIFSFFIKQIKN